MKRIKLKKHTNFKIWKPLILIAIVYLSLNYFYKDISLNNSNESFINNLLSNSNYHFINEKENNNIFSKFINKINSVEIDKPISIINSQFAYNNEIEVPIINTPQTFFYAHNLVVDKPRVYIYSTHNNEGYLGNKIEGYDLEPGVTLASILIQEKLNKKGIMTIVEERGTIEYQKENNLGNAYYASRIFLKEKLKEYGDFDLIIDLHRDAVSKEVSSTNINGKDYAKTMLVMNKYLPNLNFANKLDDIINKKYPGLSRGIYYKYEDQFNQDLDENAILIELGANYNTFDEVLNSIDALVESIEVLLNES